MIKGILKIIAILVLGAVGGLLFQIFVLPYLLANPYFEKFQFVKNFKEKKKNLLETYSITNGN